MELYDSIEARLKAYIHPLTPQTNDQEAAFSDAVEAQIEYEASLETEGIPGNVQSFSTGGMSVTLSEGMTGAYTRNTLCPTAWALLFNAGLIQHAMPVARRL